MLKVVEARDGSIYVRMTLGGYSEIDGGKAVLVPSSQIERSGWIVGREVTKVLQDSRGDWWATTGHEVYRLPGPALHSKPANASAPLMGSPRARSSSALTGIHEDTAGRIWIASRHGLVRCDAPSSRSARFAFLPLVGFAEWDEITDVLSDRSGNVWLRTLRDVARVVEG